MRWSGRHSLVLLAHVTQSATPQKATPPSSWGQLPFNNHTGSHTPPLFK